MNLILVVVLSAVVTLLAGCQAGKAESAVLFRHGTAAESTLHVQRPGVAGPGPALPRAGPWGRILTAPAAGIAAANKGGGQGSAGLLVLTQFRKGDEGERVLVREWAWDFALRADGQAVAFVAGRERRELWVATAPDWQARVRAVPADARPAEPCWLADGTLAVLLARGEASELVTLETQPHVLLHADAAEFSSPCALPGGGVLVVETPRRPEPAAGRLQRVLAGRPVETLAQGFFLPGTVAVSPDGRALGAVWSNKLEDLRTGQAGWRWIGAAPAGWPAEIPRSVSAVWSPDGLQLAVARHEPGRHWIEVHRAGATALRIGFEAAEFDTSPQWWRVAP